MEPATHPYSCFHRCQQRWAGTFPSPSIAPTSWSLKAPSQRQPYARTFGQLARRVALGSLSHLGPYATKRNDFRFDNYHIFRAKIRMVLPSEPQ